MAKDQKDLPGMEDREISELQNAAVDYAKLRDRRMNLNTKEAEAKENLLALMKKHNKKKYVHGGVEIERVFKEETVRVRIHSEEGESTEE